MKILQTMEGEFWKFVYSAFGPISKAKLVKCLQTNRAALNHFAKQCVEHCPCEYDQGECLLQQYLFHGCPIQLPGMWQLIHFAAAQNHRRHCLLLLQHGVNINARTADWFHASPLELAYVYEGHESVSHVLFEHGAKYLDHGSRFPLDRALRFRNYFSARIEACRRAAGAATHALRAKGVLKDLAVLVGKAIWATQRRPEWADLIQ